jgi:hypothetical protein
MIDRLKVQRSDEEQTRELGGTSCAFFMTDGHNSHGLSSDVPHAQCEYHRVEESASSVSKLHQERRSNL